jgi:hypothetical protein
MLRCEECKEPRSKWSARLCRSCYLGVGLTGTEKEATQKWLRSDQIPIDEPTKEYFVAEAEKRGLTFTEILSALLLTIADDKMAAAILDD